MNSEDSNKREDFSLMPEETLLQEIIPSNPESGGEVEIIETPDISVPPITKQYLKVVKQMMPSGNRYFFTDGISKVEVKVISDEIIRIRLAPQGEFLDEFSYAVSDYKFHITRIETTETNDHYIISTNAVSCHISKLNFHISFHDVNDVVINEDAQPMHWEEHTQYGGYYVFSSKKYQEGEHFFGLGNKPMNLDLLGVRVQNWGSDTYNFARGTDPLYKNIPFYTGIHHGISYGIFFDNPSRLKLSDSTFVTQSMLTLKAGCGIGMRTSGPK
jgi:alpha-glucosidase